MWHIKVSAAILRPILRLLDWLKPLASLLARFWIAYIFFQSGLTKINDMAGTVMLFANQYQVPLLPPTVAAYLGTSLELLLPVLLVLGLGGRFSLFVFFVYNIACVISFHFLLTPAGAPGLADHISWGIILLLLMVHGMGKISADYWIRKKWGHHLTLK